MKIYCCNCAADVNAKQITGKIVYPHRRDLHSLPFWQCPTCFNFVGCHHKSNTPTKPLGCIPSNEIKAIRRQIHAKLDPIWKGKTHSRSYVYKFLSSKLGYQYHTAEIRSVCEGLQVLQLLDEV